MSGPASLVVEKHPNNSGQWQLNYVPEGLPGPRWTIEIFGSERAAKDARFTIGQYIDTLALIEAAKRDLDHDEPDA